MVYIILGTGFEEAEAIIPCDLLRRAGVPTQLVGIDALEVTGGHGITLRADITVREADFSGAEMLVLPGGLGGVASIRACSEVMLALRQAYDGGKFVAAICAAPTVLAELGLTDGKNATCYPGMEEQMGSARLCDADAVADGKLITGRAAGAAFAFGLKLVEALRGVQTAQAVAAGVVYQEGGQICL